MTALNSAAAAFYDTINAAASPEQLDNLARAVWYQYGEGAFSDDEATFLDVAIRKRRPTGRPWAAVQQTVGSLGSAMSRWTSRFKPRQRARCPNRQASRERRRRLGGSSVLPDTLRHHYTEGQRAVLCIVAGEVKHHGVCDLPIDKIAALAGVCRTTVQTTLHEARRLDHIEITERPVSGRKNLPNLIKIISREWRAWIKRGPSAHRPIGSKSMNLVSTTKNKEFKKEGKCVLKRRKGTTEGEIGGATSIQTRSELVVTSLQTSSAAIAAYAANQRRARARCAVVARFKGVNPRRNPQ